MRIREFIEQLVKLVAFYGFALYVQRCRPNNMTVTFDKRITAVEERSRDQSARHRRVTIEENTAVGEVSPTCHLCSLSPSHIFLPSKRS